MYVPPFLKGVFLTQFWYCREIQEKMILPMTQPIPHCEKPLLYQKIFKNLIRKKTTLLLQQIIDEKHQLKLAISSNFGNSLNKLDVPGK